MECCPESAEIVSRPEESRLALAITKLDADVNRITAAESAFPTTSHAAAAAATESWGTDGVSRQRNISSVQWSGG
jgi:hypothetical protein